jgi:hypothetical protein
MTTSNVKPISPKEVIGHKQKIIPDEVILQFNDIIAEKFNNGRSYFKQNEIVERICKAMEVERDVVFKKHYLDVEGIYEKVGWKVEYDKPGFNETYEANFTFTVKKPPRNYAV